MNVRERAKGIGLGVFAAALLVAPASASAASPYFVAPTAMGAGTCANAANACDIYTGVTMATMDGDQVLMADGTYSLQLGGPLGINSHAITVKPSTAGTRPIITSTNGNNVEVGFPGATIQDVKIDVSGLGGGGRALDMQAAGTALRVQVIAAGASSYGVLVKNGALLSDSTVQAVGSNGVAVVTGGNMGTPTAHVRNVTAIATGATSNGLAAFSSFGAPQVVEVNNTILRGTAADINAVGAAPMNVTVNVDHSNFVTTIPPPPTPNAVINDNGGNQSQAPLFVNAAGGNFTQLDGSPTIDKGAAVGGLGPLDFSSGSRVLGLAPDIGADEFPSAGPTQFPNATTSTTTTKKKCKKKKKKSKSAVASKKCKKKKKKK